MKIIVLSSIWFCAISVLAQTNYYNETKTFHENGYIYQCDVPAWKLVMLYNKSNQWTNVNQIYKSTDEPFVVPDAGIDLFEDDNWSDAKCKSIVDSAFSSSEKQRVKGYDFTISMYINTTTGKVDEVNFTFVNFGPYATIPVSVYRKIETEVKENIWFTLTNEGKKLNYILYWWSQEPK